MKAGLHDLFKSQNLHVPCHRPLSMRQSKLYREDAARCLLTGRGTATEPWDLGHPKAWPSRPFLPCWLRVPGAPVTLSAPERVRFRADYQIIKSPRPRISFEAQPARLVAAIICWLPAVARLIICFCDPVADPAHPVSTSFHSTSSLADEKAYSIAIELP